MLTSHSAMLRIKIGMASPALRAAARRLWSAPSPGERYTDYLCAMHGVVRASVPLMETARLRCRAAPHDPVAGPLAAYLAAHIADELGHEEWLREDIAATGHDPGESLRRVPPASVAVLAGAQYYWLSHYHPVTLLGYIAVLEGAPPHPELAARLAAATGYSAAAFRTLSVHADADPRHGAEVFRLLDRLPLTKRQQAAVGLSALHTVTAAARVLEELAARQYTAGGADG